MPFVQRSPPERHHSTGASREYRSRPPDTVYTLAHSGVQTASPRRVAHRHVLDAADEVGAQPLWLARQRDLFKAVEQLIEHDAQLEPREAGAQAEVLADAE